MKPRRPSDGIGDELGVELTAPDADAATHQRSSIDLLPPDARFRVTVLDGPDASASIHVDGSEEILVGQSPACALRLRDVLVSRRHLALDSRAGRLRVRDLGSTNGTLVNGLQIVEATLRGGEQIRIGATTLAVHDVGAVRKDREQSAAFGELLGESRAMRRLFPILARLATSSIPVLIEGETGTGKEVAARALHDNGPLRAAPFVVFDCAAVAASLIESELFGHERGAFTGAVGTRKGVFEQAHGGTLFLDEIADLPLDLQSKLLRALERSEVRRVGGATWITCNVRVVAATRRNVEAHVQDGRFRDDLFHRLAVGRVELPPLRERREDIPRLVAHFTKLADPTAAPIPARVAAEWATRPWAGNVRELRNAVFRYAALGDLSVAPDADESIRAPSIFPADGESELDALLRLKLPYPDARDRMQRAFEKRYVAAMLAAAGGSVQKAATLSGIALRYFQQLRARSLD